MALFYQTEYRMGRRGRICRTYTGLQALVAIAIDLVFGLLFEFVLIAANLLSRAILLAFHLAVELLRIVWNVLLAVMTVLVYLVTLPFALIHQGADWLWSQLGPRQPEADQGSVRKRDWVLSREV
jgi:hypothetical protein